MFEKYEVSRYLKYMINNKPNAQALVMGSDFYPKIHGNVYFYQIDNGVMVAANIKGLPHSNEACGSRIFGFHIHEGGSCTGPRSAPLAGTGLHYDKLNCEHPHHSGDMPPLFENNGNAFMIFFTDRITINGINGGTVVIHEWPDDFISQPSGNVGEKIACGEIRKTY